MAKSDEVPIVFVQPEFNKKTAQVIADAIGAKVITIAPWMNSTVRIFVI